MSAILRRIIPLAVCLLVLSVAARGQTTLTLLENGVNPYAPGSNVMLFAGPAGTYSFTFPNTVDFSGITGALFTNDTTGNFNLGESVLRFNATKTAGATASTLEIIANDPFFSGLIQPYSTLVGVSGASIGGTGGTLNVPISDTGTFAGTTTVSATEGSTTPTLGSSTSAGTFTGKNPYTLTEDVAITLTNAEDSGTVTGSDSANATPEPASLVLIGSGVAILWRKSKKKA